jgi:hypothetical protein
MPFTKGPRNPVVHFEDGVTVLALKRANGDVLPCFVDTVDYSDIKKYRWFASSGHTSIYVQTSTFINRRHSGIYLHSLLMDEKFPDHKNGNGLDNRRNNLRTAGPINNARNVSLRKTSKSGYKGVSWSTRRGRWEVRCLGRFLGYYLDVVIAARVYDTAAIQYFGEFAKTNFPQGVKHDRN